MPRNVSDSSAGLSWATNSQDWTGARKARPLQQLLPMTYRWAESLPGSSRPSQLMQMFPRLANRIASTWDDQSETLDVLDDLIIDRRGGRRGFPPFVLAELLWLRDLAERR